MCIFKLTKVSNSSLPDFFQAQNAPKPAFGRGSIPDPAGGAYNAPSDPLVGWGGGYPLPIPSPLDAFGVSNSAPMAPRYSGPSVHNFLATPLELKGSLQSLHKASGNKAVHRLKNMTITASVKRNESDFDLLSHTWPFTILQKHFSICMTILQWAVTAVTAMSNHHCVA